MSLSQMQVFNKYFMPATIETLAQMVEKFNAASGGAIRLTTEGFEGDFLQESFYAAIHSARRRVDRYASNATATPTDLIWAMWCWSSTAPISGTPSTSATPRITLPSSRSVPMGRRRVRGAISWRNAGCRSWMKSPPA